MDNKLGVFYIIQVFPRDDVRYKCGFTNFLPGRLKNYSTICPDVVVTRRYDCHATNERKALGFIKEFTCVTPIGQEVFDITDIKRVLRWTDDLFMSVDMTVPNTNLYAKVNY